MPERSEWTERHPATAHFKPLFHVGHLAEPLQHVSALFRDLAVELLANLDDGPELSAGLRKLLEAKDCCVRSAVLSMTSEPAAS